MNTTQHTRVLPGSQFIEVSPTQHANIIYEHKDPGPATVIKSKKRLSSVIPLQVFSGLMQQGYTRENLVLQGGEREENLIKKRGIIIF